MAAPAGARRDLLDSRLPPLPPPVSTRLRPRPAPSSLPARARWSLAFIALAGSLPFLLPLKSAPVPSFHAEALSALLGLLAMIPVLRSPFRMELPRVVLLPLGLGALIGLQLLLHRLPFPQTGLLGCLYLLWAAGLMVLGAHLRREHGVEPVARTLAWGVLLGALASALIGWSQHIGSSFPGALLVMPPAPERIWANLGQPNHLADYLALGLVCLVYLRQTGRLGLFWAVPAAAALVYALALTGSRASWVYLGLLVLLAVSLRRRGESGGDLQPLLFSAGALLLFLAIGLTAGAGGSAAVGGAAPAAVVERLSPEALQSEERPRLWGAAWRMFREAPLLGVGFRNYGYTHFLINPALPEPRVLGFNDHAHNLLLNVLAEFGVAGGGLLLVCALLWLRAALAQPNSPEKLWLLGFLLVLGVHSAVEYPLWYAFFLGPAALLLGLGEPDLLQSAPRSVGRAWFLASLMLAFGMLGLGQLFLDYRRLENFLAFRYGYLNATEAVNREARNLLLELNRGSLLSPLVVLGLARSVELTPERVADKLAVNHHAERLFPVDDVVYRQAMLLALAGQREPAFEQWRRALASFPGEQERAMRLLEPAAASQPQLARLLGDIQEAAAARANRPKP